MCFLDKNNHSILKAIYQNRLLACVLNLSTLYLASNADVGFAGSLWSGRPFGPIMGAVDMLG